MDDTANNEVVGHREPFGDELPPGTQLCAGQYEIESYLNAGGFGITYLARDSLGRRTVVKECFPGALCCRTAETVRLRSKGGEPEFGKILELFEKEARALSELQHPYIVAVHQIFKDNDTAYMALDYINGRDLLHVIEEEPDRLDPEQVKQILLKVLDAVAYMHDHDILHRDISPDNILLEDDNSPVLIDFGAARESASRVSRVLSKVMTVKDGYSPQEFYLSGSEQAFSSDLYALAATFYHLVSGRAPTSSQVRMAAAAKKQADPLEPLTTGTVKGYDGYFLDAINRCLSIFPSERLQSAREWRDLIDTERRQRRLLEQAKHDRAMEMRIAEVVQDAQRDVELAPRSEKPAQPARVAVSRPKPRAQPRPARVAAGIGDAGMVPDKVVTGETDAETNCDAEIPVSMRWKEIPLDGPFERSGEDMDLGSNTDQAEYPERSDTLFGRFFDQSVLVRVFRAALNPGENEVGR